MAPFPARHLRSQLRARAKMARANFENDADDRFYDIRRTVAELRDEFLARENKEASFKQKILNQALTDPSVTAEEYRVLSLLVASAKALQETAP